LIFHAAHPDPVDRPIPILVITGQTATGKHRLAVAAAERLGGEILSADSMKVYRGMDIGTAKPSPAQRRGIPHHLVDLVEPSETFSTARWVPMADAAMADVHARGRVPIVCGGTALYLKALLEGLFAGPSADPLLRQRLVAEAKARGTPALHARLAEVDPEAARRIHPNDLRRIVRALEVWELAGEPISKFQTQWGRRRGKYRALMMAIRRTREDLERRIEKRVQQMAQAGLLEEVRRLAERPEGLAHGPRQALGYAEVLEHLEGQRTWDETLRAIVLHTRQFARRQRTWLRRFKDLVWLDASPETPTETLAEQVADLWRAHRTAR